MTQLHISQLGRLSVCSAPLLGNQERGAWGIEERRRGREGGGENEVGGRPKVTVKVSLGLVALNSSPVGISDVVLT